MKVLPQISLRNSVFNISKNLLAGYFTQSGRLLTTSMTGRKLEDDTEDTPNKKLCVEQEKKIGSLSMKRKHVALLLAYSGANYHGMQINCGFKTVEGELLQALHSDGLIPEGALSMPQIVNFQRAARTDKGVSASKQVVSLYLGIDFNIDNINKHLPEDVRVFSIRRVTKGFNSRNYCTARTYSYTMPSFALAPEFHEEFPQNYRVDQETIKKVDNILQSYKGSNIYHNFTSRKAYDDPSSRRYIISFNAGTPFIENGEEFITLTIKGQSFMLHQIRKMVGHMVAILKGKVSEDIQTNVWKNEKYAVPLAPGLGLILEDLHFDMYNNKYGKDGLHEPLVWSEIAEELQDFKKKYILSNIINTEIEEKVTFNWLLKLKDHSYSLENSEDQLKEDELKEDELKEEAN